MPAFLSQEWIEELDAAAASVDPRALEGARISVAQAIELGEESGEMGYTLRIAQGAARVVAGAARDADVTICQDLATATAIAQGELSALAAFMAGRLQVSGDVQALIDHQVALAALDEAFAPLRARTTF